MRPLYSIAACVTLCVRGAAANLLLRSLAILQLAAAASQVRIIALAFPWRPALLRQLSHTTRRPCCDLITQQRVE